MNYNLLSLSQTLPLWVPMRFFLSAPFFLLLAALLLLTGGPDLFATRWSPAMLALTHLLTLGFLGLCMVGAIQQLLPVLAGVVLPRANALSWLFYLAWTGGSLLLIGGMALRLPLLSLAGGLLLGITILFFVVVTGIALLRSGSRHATIPAMSLALLGLLLTATIILSILWHFGWHTPLAHPLTRLHIGWGTVGWLAMLVIAVAYQVVPMFQLTSPYPVWLRRLLAPALFLSLVLWSLWPWLSFLPASLLILFAAQTLSLQYHRRRHTQDSTLDFWRLAMLALLASGVLWLVYPLHPTEGGALLLGVLFLLGFGVSTVNGMLYKIAPFLIWLHLNNHLQQSGQWQGKIPTMNQIIPPQDARNQFWLHLLGLGLLLLAVWRETSPWLAGVALTASAGMLWWNLWRAVAIYRRLTTTVAD
jgi:hypothetical protein